MLDLRTPEEMALIPTIDLNKILGKSHSGGSGCNNCEAYRPEPQLSGNLQLDPEIVLTGPYPLDISTYYNSASTANGLFGYGRTMSQFLTAQASGSPLLVTLTRDNGAQVSYAFDGTNYMPQTAGCLNSLVQDATNGYWKETTLDGETTAYPLDTAGHVTTVAYQQDSTGNIHTYTYVSGVLINVVDGPGRVATFTWMGGVIEKVTDWADRVLQFKYDTVTASPLKLLTTMIGPTLCTTEYQYATFTQYNAGAYSSAWFLSGVVSPNGFGTSYLYDMQGRVTNRIIQGVGTYTYLYAPDTMMTIDPMGGIVTQALGTDFSITGTQNPLGANTSFTRNSNLQETSRQAPLGGIWTTNYLSNGLISSTETPLGAITTLGYDSYNNIQTKQTPDSAVWTTLFGYAGSSFDTTGAKRKAQVTIDPLGNRVTMGYTAQGMLQFTQDMAGAIVTLGYNSVGDQIFRQDATGQLWTTTRDLAGNAIAQINPLNATWSQTFDKQNRPLNYTDPLNNVTQNGYDSEGNRTVLITPLGFRTSWTYNVFNSIVSTQDALNNYVTNVYDSLGRRIGVIDSLSNISSTIFDSAGRPIAQMNSLGAIWTTTLDANGRPISAMNPLGFATTKVWDSADRPIASIDELGNISTTTFNVNSKPIASQNPLGFLSSAILDLASRPIAQVDAMNNRSSTVFDGRNLPIAQIDPLNRITSTTYNANKAPIATMDPAGFLATTLLDAAGNTIGNIDSNGNLSSIILDAANRPIAQIDALNFRSSTTYDADSNPVKMTDALNRITTNVIDHLDRVQATVTPLGFRTTINRDADGRTISVQNASGFLNSTIYDAASNQIASISPMGLIQTTIRDAANQVIGNQNSLSQIYTNVLDAAGRPIASVNPMGFRSSVQFDAASQPIATIDALGNRATSVWAANGKVIASQNELGAPTSFILDAASQRICVVDANNGRSTTVFDVRGLKSVEIDQLSARTSFTQDPNGNTVLRVDARNWPTTYTIDQLNRTAQTQYIDNTRVTNTWDAASQQITSQDVTGITSMVWDLNSRKTATQNPTGINLTSTLDPVGNRLVLKDNYGATTYTWDSQSRLLSIWNPLNERTTMQWDALDREQHRVLANGGTISHTWDAAGRETLIENRNAAGVGQFIATNTYSQVDNRLAVLELDGTRATFAYDATSQITSEARGGTMAYARSYTWDPLGNRLQQYDSGVLTTGTFNKANQLLVSTPATGPATTTTYDAVGNIIGINTGGALTTQIWSAENRLASYADSKGNSEQFLYSDDGLKKKRVVGAATTLFTYDESALLLETDTSNNLQARYTNSPKTWGGLASQSRSGVSSFYGFDSQLCARILVSMAGFITDAYSWKAFGEPIQTGSGTVNPYGYIALALYYTELVDLINTWNRWLKASIGRFTSMDPIGFRVEGSNWYVYVQDDPVSYADPEGRQRTDKRKKNKSKGGLPPKLKKCLGSITQGQLLAKLAEGNCKKAINVACGKAGGPALNDPTIVPKWEFPDECVPGRPYILGFCPQKFSPVASDGDPCKPKGICLNKELCDDGDPELDACMVLWELGNACGCKHGYESSENTAQRIVDACQCQTVVGGAGGTGHY